MRTTYKKINHEFTLYETKAMMATFYHYLTNIYANRLRMRDRQSDLD